MFFALFLFAFVNCKQRKRRNAKYDAQKDGRWFYQQLTKYQKPFYEALEYWRANNLLTGAPMMYLESDSNLKNKVQETIIKQYVLGSSGALNTHFLSAVAAWRADHPEIFYIDVSKLLFRISQDETNHYHILFGCISYPNLLFDFVKSDQINSMIDTFNSKVKEVVNLAKDKETIEEKVIVVHDYLKENVVYNRPYQTSTEEEANWVYYPYGSLILGKSVCDGFAKAFQVIMNELNVPSVQVSGDALNSTNESQSHSWNVVEVGDTWLMVDCTYDTTSKTNNWLLIDQQNTAYTHFPNGQLDSCGVTFYFPPSLFPNYEKFTTKYLYDSKDPTKINGVLASYDGMNNSALLAKNLSICFRNAFFKNDGTIQYSQWVDLYKYGNATGADVSSLDYDANYSIFPIGSVSFFQVGIAYSYTERIDMNDFIKNCVVDDKNVFLQSARYYINCTFENMTMNENLLNPQVRYYSPTPRHFWPGHEYDFVFAMSEMLIPEDDQDVNLTKFKITVTAASLNTFDKRNGRDKILGEEAAKKTIIRNVRLINPQTIGVTIKTSDSYAHDHMDYTLHFEGIKGSVSLKKPLPFTFMVHFFPNNGGTNTCSKMFGTGTLYVAGRPVLITDGDIRNGGLNNDFTATGPDGVIPGKGATSSDLALVATRAEGDDDVYEEFSATFDISLTLFCMSYLITPGTYNCPLTIQLPFPDGFDPTKNKDVSFEVIHYNKDGTVNEKNTVVVGSSGLLITVNGFSPFKIQRKKESSLALEDVKYPLYTSSFGGSPTVTITDNKITNIVHDYVKDQTIKVVPPTGTQVEKIFLNSEQLNVNDLNSFSLPVDLLNQRSNTLEVHLISKSALDEENKISAVPVHITANITALSQSDEAKKLAAKQTGASPPANNLNEDNAIYAPDYDDDDDNDQNEVPKDDGNKKSKSLSTGAIVGIVVGVVAVVAIAVLLVYFLVIKPRKASQVSNDYDQ